MGQSNLKLVSWAAQDGRVKDLIYHLESSGSIGLKPAPGAEKRRTPLHLAAIGGYLECISILYDAGADLNVKDEDGMTALHLAAANGHYHAVQLLLDIGANEKLTTRFGISAFHLATSCGHTPIMRVLASHGADIDKQESWGQTPLIIATQKSRLDCMKVLLEMGADRECHDHHHGNTALHIACTTKDEETLLVLLDGHCNVQAVNLAGLTPLGVAVENKFYRAIPLLLEYGAKPNHNDYALCSIGLEQYLLEKLCQPLSLVRLSRVSVRQTFGPTYLEKALSSEVTEELQEYVKSIRDHCCSSNEVKTCALLGRTISTNNKPDATTKF